jgi:hypothetical protein
MYFTFWQLRKHGDTYIAEPYINIYKDMIEWRGNEGIDESRTLLA